MNGAVLGPDLSLTPDQEGLLRTALSSNNPTRNSPRSASNQFPSTPRSNSDPKSVQQLKAAMATGSIAYTSPTDDNPGSGQLGSFDESPFLDYDLDDGTFDWDNNGDQLFGDLPGGDFNDDSEHHEKRKASNDDEDEEEGSSKRREGEDKSAKKPGRKPLTGEPTTKRKAQNRAAQRAFRERKERHLKDLETKVDDLEKASEATNHENGRLRAQVEKLNMELKEYRKRLSLNTSGASQSPPQSATQSRNFYGANGGDFNFAFPKFGDLPGSTFMSNGSMTKTSSPTPISQQPSPSNTDAPGLARRESSGSTNGMSRTSVNGNITSPLGTSRPYQASTNGFNTNGHKNNSFDELHGLFSPSILQNASRSNSADYVSYPNSTAPSSLGSAKQHSSSSVDGQSRMPNIQRGSSTSITGSPTSSVSHTGLDSSCGTTPESCADSPDNRKSSDYALNTINEETITQGKSSEAPTGPSKASAADINGIDWMAQQNGGQFDPVLFGEYRDPQDNILNNTFGDFFNDAFGPLNDFGSPYNSGDFVNPAPKRDLMKEIEVTQNGSAESTLKQANKKEEALQFLTCDKLWDRVQASQKAQTGEADMDELCSQLKAKAKCSGSGAVIEQKDVDAILGPAPGEQTNFLKMFS